MHGTHIVRAPSRADSLALRGVIRRNSIRDRRKKREQVEAKHWLQNERQKKKKWTNFSYPLTRLRYCYNLCESAFNAIKDLYLTGNRAGSSENSDTQMNSFSPKNQATIRQDILAVLLIGVFKLSRPDFITAKGLATARNLKKAGSNTSTEHMKWPARPDLFEHCPEPNDNGVSDDEMMDHLVQNVFPCDASDEEGVEVSTENEDDDILNLDEIISDDRPFNSRKVSLLRDLVLTYGTWGHVDNTVSKYAISRSKAFDVRSVIHKLHEGEIPHATWDEFIETFNREDLMNMGLQKNKADSIVQVIRLYTSEIHDLFVSQDSNSFW